MKVAVDTRMLNMSGIGTYIQNLLKRDCYNIVLGKPEELSKYDSHFEYKIEYDSKIYGIKEQLKFPYRKLRKLKPDVLHVPHYNVPIFYRGKMIVTIHDLTHLILPEFLPNKLAKLYAKIMICIALKKAYKVVTVSENTKNDILKMFKVDSNKIVVIYPGVSEEFNHRDTKEIQYLYDKYSIPQNKKLLMYVGNLKPHKNLERLLKAFSLLKDKDNYRLILVGKSFSNQLNLKTIENELQISNYVIHTGIVEQNELVDFYNLVDLFIFPSLYEGFGSPIVEAINCGTNIICSNVSAIPEVAGNNIDYFNPYNVEDIKNKIEKNINKKLNSKTVTWVKKFNYDKTANELKKILNDK